MSVQAPHTAGPWKRFGWSVYTGDAGKVTAIARCAANYAVDTSDDPEWNGQGPREHEATANTRLIAAAPELLSALEALLDQADETYPHFEDVRGTSNRDAARAALDKAKRCEQSCLACDCEN